MPATTTDGSLILATTTFPFIIAVIFALLRTKQVSNWMFVDPALQAIEQVEEKTKPTTTRASLQWIICSNRLVRPFVEMTVMRTHMVAYLISIFVGLCPLVPISLTQSIHPVSATISILVYLALFLATFGYLVFLQKEVFGWWRSVKAKLLTVGLFWSATAIGSQKIDTIDFYQMATEPYILFRMNGFVFTSLYIIIAILLFVVLFPVARSEKRKRWPSFRSKIEDWVADGKVFTTNQAHQALNPSSKEIFRIDEIQWQIDEMVYQGVIRLVVDVDHCPVRPDQIRYTKKT